MGRYYGYNRVSTKEQHLDRGSQLSVPVGLGIHGIDKGGRTDTRYMLKIFYVKTIL